jgi:hypothetical protein
MEIVETEANIDTLNWYIHDLSLSRLTYTWPLTLQTDIYMTSHSPDWHIHDLSLSSVYVSLESERSCICQSGEWEVMYMSVWRVRGHVYVSLESERSCICQSGEWEVYTLPLTLQTDIYMTSHSPDWHIHDLSLSRLTYTWPLTLQTDLYMTSHSPDWPMHDLSLSRLTYTWSLTLQTDIYTTSHFPDWPIHDLSLSRLTYAWPLTLQTDIYMTFHSPDWHIHDLSLSRFGTLDSGIKLALWSQNFLLSEMMLSCKCFYMVFCEETKYIFCLIRPTFLCPQMWPLNTCLTKTTK